MADPLNIDTHLGNTKWVKFRVRRKNLNTVYDVSLSSQILLEVGRVGDPAPLTPIPCVNTAPGASWITGLVPCLLSAGNVTARVGTYKYALTVFNSPYEDTVDSGFIEVRDRPVTAYALPGGGGNQFTATNVNSGINAGTSIIRAGMPIARLANGVDAAVASGAYLQADGIAISDCIPGSVCLYISNGSLRLSDWTAVFGAPSLPVGSSLYLDKTTGHLTTTLPAIPDFSLLQIVGETQDSAQTLYLTFGYTVAL
jgi:hypothetical protein